MIHYLAMTPLIGLHLLVFLCLGMLAERLFGEEGPLPYALVTGYLVWFALFEAVTLAATLLRAPTHVLGWITAGAGAAAIAAGLYAGRARLRAFPRQVRSAGVDRSRLLLLLLLAVVAAECIAAALYTDGSQDAVQYVGSANTAVFTDGLYTHSADTGKRLKYFSGRYAYFNYPMFSAAVSSFFHTPVIIHFRIMLSVVNVMVTNLVWHRTAAKLFAGKDKAYADLTVILAGLISLCSGSIYQQGAFFFTRIYEGKAVIANICAAAVIWCCLRLYEDVGDRFAWFMLGCNALAAVCFSGSGYLILLASGAFALPALIHGRRPGALAALAAACAPAAAVMVLYMLRVMGILKFRIVW